MKKRSIRFFLQNAPLGWTLIRASEIVFLSKVRLRRPLLDIGCGTGLFAEALLTDLGQKKFDVGMDLSDKELREAKKLSVYKRLILADVHKMPFKNNSFATIISNGTLEHVNNLPSAISEISRVLGPGGKLVFTAPSSFFSRYLFFSFIPGYSRVFNYFFAHKNLLDYKRWKDILEARSFIVKNYFYYNTKKQIIAHELLTFFGVFEQISKYIFGSWVLFPNIKKYFLRFEEQILNLLYNDAVSKKEGGSIFIIAEKKNEKF